jgi:hypothetical protein
MKLDLHALLPRLVVPGVMAATAIALTALAGTCGREASGGYPQDTRARAMVAIGSCDAALANMHGLWEESAPGLTKLLATDRKAALVYLETRIGPIIANPVATCESARALVRELFEDGQNDMRLREDGGRMMLHAPRVAAAQQAYLALQARLERDERSNLAPLVDTLARAVR